MEKKRILDRIGSSMRSTLLWENANLLVKNHVSPSKIPCSFVPVDMDVTPCDNSKTKKEGVSRTCKGCGGYAPMMAYIGREGYLINCGLRKGIQHCQKHMPEFLRETIDACRKVTKGPLLFRLDSGSDSTENIGIFLGTGCSFIIKRSLRRESKEGWLKELKDKCLDITSPRDGKTVYIGSAWRDISYVGLDGEKHPFTVRTVYEIVERNIDKHGQYLLPADMEINMWDQDRYGSGNGSHLESSTQMSWYWNLRWLPITFCV